MECSCDLLAVCILADIDCPVLTMVYNAEVSTAEWNTSERKNNKKQQIR
jgi:hypothetical protein